MASTIKVDNVQNTPGTNIVSKCGTDVTIGASGDTVALACGASQTGFGRTGTVDWVTTPKVTGDSPITAATGSGYFLNTTAGTITINLPAGAAGSIVSMADYAATWQTYNVTVSANGSEKIGGETTDAILSTKGQSVTLVYVDSTQGWVNTMDSTSNVRGQSPYLTATVSGACNSIVSCGDYKVAVFKGPGTFCVATVGLCAPNNNVDYVVVGGGGGTSDSSPLGCGWAGGGGAGGYRESPGTATCYTASPLGAAPAAAVTVSVQGYPIAVGGGGAGTACSPGNVSTALCISGAGGGGGSPGRNVAGLAGGSGGGGGGCGAGGTAGAGNTPPTNPSQGFSGGIGLPGSPEGGGGGGGGAAVGVAGGSGPSCSAGCGGAGTNTGILGSSPLAPTIGVSGPAPGRYFSGGGGGGNGRADLGGNKTAPGGVGGGGTGGSPPCHSGTGPGTAGTDTTGGGGGAVGGQTGGSGIVIIRYKFQ